MAGNLKDIKIVLSAGGTGGHLFPAQAIAEELIAHGSTPILVYDERVKHLLQGTFTTIKSKMVESYRFNGNIYIKFKALIYIFVGILKLRRYFKEIKPDAVIGFGGYASFSSIIAALSLGIKVYLHEQNSILGRVNRYLQYFAKGIFTSFKNTARIKHKYLNKVHYTGFCVRKEIYNNKIKKASKKFKVLIIGGSQGAQVFSKIVPAAVTLLPKSIQKVLDINQQARPELLEATINLFKDTDCKYNVVSFFSNIAELMCDADLVISRSGSSTIGEIIALNKASILIPYPYATDNHQLQNAKELLKSEATIVIDENKLNAQDLASLIQTFYCNREMLSNIANNAASLNVKDGIKSCVNLLMGKNL